MINEIYIAIFIKKSPVEIKSDSKAIRSYVLAKSTKSMKSQSLSLSKD